MSKYIRLQPGDRCRVDDTQLVGKFLRYDGKSWVWLDIEGKPQRFYRKEVQRRRKTKIEQNIWDVPLLKAYALREPLPE